MKQDPIKKFDKATVQKITKEAGDALEAVAAKYGLKLERKSVTYYADTMPVGFRFLTIEKTEDGEVLDTDAKNLRKYAFQHGLGEEAYGKEFTQAGNTFRITGYKPKSRKYPIIAENVKTGKKYKFPEHTVQLYLKAA